MKKELKNIHKYNTHYIYCAKMKKIILLRELAKKEALIILIAAKKP